MKNINLLLVITIALVLSGCADVSPHVTDCVTPNAYGFWSGLWHGFIAPLSWLGSLVYDDIAIYAYDNNGGWYDFGFICGIWGIGFSFGKA